MVASPLGRDRYSGMARQFGIEGRLHYRAQFFHRKRPMFPSPGSQFESQSKSQSKSQPKSQPKSRPKSRPKIQSKPKSDPKGARESDSAPSAAVPMAQSELRLYYTKKKKVLAILVRAGLEGQCVEREDNTLHASYARAPPG